jgi:valyl-tRNA synthetase
MELPQRYDPKEAEKRWLSYWEQEQIYKFNPDTTKEIFSIDTPPPTVSGKMHIGHAFSYTQMDFIARFHRMKGEEIFYPFGTDDNGLATERLIESINNVKNTNMDRKVFVKLCLDTLDKIRPDFVQDWKNLGVSADYSIHYSTINEHCQRISQKSFLDLYTSGREYRKNAPIMWCPECHMAIAQVELEDKEKDSQFVFMRFKVETGDFITIATTRPELMPACVAIFVHPDDERYKKFVGKKVSIPFFNRHVKVFANEAADPNFGSGAVYHCTFGDADDIDWVIKYKLPIIEVMNKDGTLNEKAGKYKGMRSKAARKAIIADLQEAGLIEKIEPVRHVVNVHERCQTEIEFIMTEEWFIKYLDLKDEFLRAGNELVWFPPFMKNRLDNWIHGLKWDWCISRQRYFGVPIPVWYCAKCKEIILADESQLPVDPIKDTPKIKACPKCGSTKFVPEQDVLDTWATSSLSPFLAADLFKKHPVYGKLFPFSLRPQAHDIVTFWLFNTMVKSLLHHNKNPWKMAMISGWALDPHGKKMSKSKGNVVDPREYITKYCADALRFWASCSKLGEDMPFQEKDFVTATKIITKLWNASKFALMHLENYTFRELMPSELTLTDRWLIAELHTAIKNSTDFFNSYEFSRARLETENFFWNIYCDYYLELIKDRLYNKDSYSKQEIESVQYTLFTTTLSVLKLFAPIMPYITEEIYHLHFAECEHKKSIHVSEWPVPNSHFISEPSLAAGRFVMKVLEECRKAKSEKKLSMKAPVKKITAKSKISLEDFNGLEKELKAATKAEVIEFVRLPKDHSSDNEILIEL